MFGIGTPPLHSSRFGRTSGAYSARWGVYLDDIHPGPDSRSTSGLIYTGRHRRVRLAAMARHAPLAISSSWFTDQAASTHLMLPRFLNAQPTYGSARVGQLLNTTYHYSDAPTGRLRQDSMSTDSPSLARHTELRYLHAPSLPTATGP